MKNWKKNCFNLYFAVLCQALFKKIKENVILCLEYSGIICDKLILYNLQKAKAEDF